MRAVGLWIAIALACGCGRPVEAELLELRAAGPDRVAPGHRLRIEGRGLPIGREARVRLEGALHRPGRAVRVLDAEVDGTVVSADRIEVPMPEATLRRLGGRGTFRGRIEVSFGADAIDGRVLGVVDDVVIDLAPPREVARAEFAARVGLVVEAPEDAEAVGVAIAAVEDGSPAAAAGLLVGDRIVELDGLRLLAPEELEPAPDAAHVSLTIVRDGLPDPAVATLDVSHVGETIPRERVRIAQLAALVLLIALAFLGPGSIAIDRLAPRGPTERPVVLALAAAIASVALHAVLSRLTIGLEGPLFAAIAGRGAATVLSASGGRDRLGAIGRAAAGALAAAAFLGATTIAIGTTAAPAVEAAQGVWPWEWTALRSPIGPLAALTALAIAACGPRALDRPRTRAIDDAFLVALAIPIAICALGGARAVELVADVRPSLAMLGYVPYAVVTALLVIVLRRARDRAAVAPSARISIGTLAVAAAAIAGAVGWLELDVVPEIEHAIGEVIAVLAVAIALRIATARAAAPARPAHAML